MQTLRSPGMVQAYKEHRLPSRDDLPPRPYRRFDQQDAEIIAHAAQHVDDATNDGPVHFDNGAIYGRCATARKMLD
jgi:hypothetical protein